MRVPARMLSAVLLTATLLLLFFLFHQYLVQLLDPALVDPVESIAGTTANAAAPDAAASAAIAERLDDRRFANALPFFALSVLLLGLTRRPLLSLWLPGIAATGLYTIDRLKFENIGNHLLPADASLVPQMLDSSGLYLDYMRQGGIGGSLLLTMTLISLVFVFEPAQRWLRPGLRISLAAGGAFGLYAIATGSTPADDWYNSEKLAFQAWNPDESVKQVGLVASLIKQASETPWQVPEADEVFVEHILALHPDTTSTTQVMADEDRPDIIVWQSESLFDPARLRDVAFEHTPELVALRDRTLHGEMFVPTYGGGTVRTEFEAMTGYPMHAFAGIQYPYTALAQKPLLSLPRQLREHGYETVAIHPYERGFWSRDRAFVNMGFDRFDDARRFDGGDYHGIYIGDDALLRHVDAALAEPRTKPLFLFAISMENHGPWFDRPNIDEQAFSRIETPAGLEDRARDQLRHYLYHLHRADRFLGELMSLVERRQRHTIVLFYGDHLPGLEAFATLPFRDGQQAPSQPVPFLLYDNRKQTGTAVAGTWRSYHLASTVLDAAGLRDSPLFRVISADRERHGASMLGADVESDRALDYDHALSHLAWHFVRQAPAEWNEAPSSVGLH
jgi:hypothetical protein